MVLFVEILIFFVLLIFQVVLVLVLFSRGRFLTALAAQMIGSSFVALSLNVLIEWGYFGFIGLLNGSVAGSPIFMACCSFLLLTLLYHHALSKPGQSFLRFMDRLRGGST